MKIVEKGRNFGNIDVVSPQRLEKQAPQDIKPKKIRLLYANNSMALE